MSSTFFSSVILFRVTPQAETLNGDSNESLLAVLTHRQLPSGYQCGLGLHRKMALVAMIVWDDQSCSGLRRVAQLCWCYFNAVHHQKTRKRYPWLSALVAAAMHVGLPTRRSRPPVAAWRFDGDLGSGEGLLTFLMMTKGTDPRFGVLRRTWC